MKIGIFGFGCVGQGLYETLERSGSVAAEIKKICIRNAEKERPIPQEWFTTDPNELLFDPEIDAVVELIDDAEAAYYIVKTALEQGKSVISANKKLLADHFEELRDLARSQGVALLYEGACCASIPILRNLEEYYDNDLLEGISGIFNGSTNFILSRIFDEGLDFETTLKKAQELGFAESNPALDVEGWDAAFKLSILTAHAFGSRVLPKSILRQGINGLSREDIQFAREKGWKIRLLARAEKIRGVLEASVLPEFVPASNPLYGVENEFNGVTVRGAFSEEQFFCGKGAGSLPTGSAVLSDLSALRYGYKYEYRKELRKPLPSGDAVVKVYFRFFEPETVVELNWEEIEESYRGRGHHYVVGSLRTSELKRFLGEFSEAGFFIRLPKEEGNRSEETVSELEKELVPLVV